MFSSYEPAPRGQNRARPTKAQRVRSRMLRSSYDKQSGSYNNARSSGSYEQSKTPWRASDWKERKAKSAAATRAARRRAAEDTALTPWGQIIEMRAAGPSQDHTHALTPWENSQGLYEYRVVAPAVVRLGAKLCSEKADITLTVGQIVSALERRMVGTVTRVRIGPERWVSEQTKQGKKLLQRVDWPPIEEREEAKAARVNDRNRNRALWLAEEANQRRWTAKAGGIAGKVAQYEAEQLEAAALAAAALVPGFALGVQAHDKEYPDALAKVMDAEPGREGYRAVVRTQKPGVAVWSHIETAINSPIFANRVTRSAVRRGGGYVLDDEYDDHIKKDLGVQKLAHEPLPEAAHKDYLPQREAWEKLRGLIDEHPAKRDQKWQAKGADTNRHWTTDALQAAERLGRPAHHHQHSSAQSQARPSSEQEEAELLGANVYDDAAMCNLSALSHDARRLVMQDERRRPTLKQHESFVLHMSGDRAALSTTLAQPWSGKLNSAEAEHAAVQADQLGGPFHEETISLRDGLIPAFIARPMRTRILSTTSATDDRSVADARTHDDATIAPLPQRGSQDYQPQGVSSTGYRRATCGRFLADQPGGLTEFERLRKSTPGAPPAGNLQQPKQQAWLASPSEQSTLEPREADRADRLWREERARRTMTEIQLRKTATAARDRA